MNIVFFGTPEFAVPSLEALVTSQHRVSAVVTAADKPRGRGRAVRSTPVAEASRRLGIPVLKPDNLEDDAFLAALRAFDADLFAVVAFRILPAVVYSMPPYGSVNLHASLLPRYRGAAPIQRALWNGETETGVTTFRIRQAVDTGNILKQRQVEILSEDDAGSLSDRLAVSGAELLLETINGLEAGTLTPIEQDASQASKAPKISRADCLIDWDRAAEDIRNQIRALSPRPGAMTFLNDQTLKIYKASLETASTDLHPGEMRILNHGIVIGTGKDNLTILELQLQGKKRMETTAFLRGFRPRGVLQLQGGET